MTAQCTQARPFLTGTGRCQCSQISTDRHWLMLGSRGHVTKVINCYILILWGWVISIRTTHLNYDYFSGWFMALGFPHSSRIFYKRPGKWVKGQEETSRTARPCWQHRFTQRVVLVLHHVSKKKLTDIANSPCEPILWQHICNIFSRIITLFVDAKHICHMFPTKDPLPWDPKASRWNHRPSSMPVLDPTRPASFAQKAQFYPLVI